MNKVTTMNTSSTTAIQSSQVVCSTCVAIAIVQRPPLCLRELLHQGKLSSEYFWLPAQDLIDPTDCTFYKLADVLLKRSCISSCTHKTEIPFRDSTQRKSIQLHNSVPDGKRTSYLTKTECEHSKDP